MAQRFGIGVLVFFIANFVCTSIFAQEQNILPKMCSPSKVLLAPNWAILTVEETVPVKNSDGEQSIFLLLPKDAEDVRIQIEGAHLVGESDKTVLYTSESRRSQENRKMLDRLASIDNALQILSNRKALWKTQPDEMRIEEMAVLDEKKQSKLSVILKEEAALEREKEVLKERLSGSGEEKNLARLHCATLVGAKEDHVAVRYTYTLRNCGWKALYAFSIDPEKAKDTISVRFTADIWQNSGLDWKNTAITLVTGGTKAFMPPKLKSWVLDANERQKASARKDSAAMYAAPEESAVMHRVNHPVMVGSASGMRSYTPTVDTSGLYARWELPVRSLSEGHASVVICESTWKDPLVWIARPSDSFGNVFVMARHEIGKDEVFPDGTAVFSVSGQTTGKANFSAKHGVVSLFFGQDPRVSLAVIQDKHKKGESGFLGRDRTWNWVTK